MQWVQAPQLLFYLVQDFFYRPFIQICCFSYRSFSTKSMTRRGSMFLVWLVFRQTSPPVTHFPRCTNILPQHKLCYGSNGTNSFFRLRRVKYSCNFIFSSQNLFRIRGEKQLDTTMRWFALWESLRVRSELSRRQWERRCVYGFWKWYDYFLVCCLYSLKRGNELKDCSNDYHVNQQHLTSVGLLAEIALLLTWDRFLVTALLTYTKRLMRRPLQSKWRTVSKAFTISLDCLHHHSGTGMTPLATESRFCAALRACRCE